MKTTANVKRYYALNLNDGRIAIATRELLTNPDYRVISERIARQIEAKEADWKQIAFQLRQRDSMNPQELMKRAEQEKVKNLRPSIVTRENVEQFETKISEQEVGEVFDGDGDAPAPAEVPPPAAPADDGGEAPEEEQPGEDAPPEAPKPAAKKDAPKRTQRQQSRSRAKATDAPAPADDGGEAPEEEAPADGEDVNL